MALADTGLWVALLAMIGREPLSVTSHLDIDFLRKPAPADVIAHTTLHKVGKRLAVGDVLMYSDGEDDALRPGVRHLRDPVVLQGLTPARRKFRHQSRKGGLSCRVCANKAVSGCGSARHAGVSPSRYPRFVRQVDERLVQRAHADATGSSVGGCCGARSASTRST